MRDILKAEPGAIKAALKAPAALRMFAAILRASSLLSNLAAERRPHGAGLWP